MELAAKVLTTESVPRSHRLSYWRDLVCDTFVELACESAAPHDFSGSIQSLEFDGTKYSHVKSSWHRVVRDKRRISNSNFTHFLLSLQLRGRGRLIQDGRLVDLEPGDFALYDVTRPYELQFEEDFEQLVVQLPRNQILSRLFDADGLVAVGVSGQSGLGRLASTLIVQTASQLDCLDAPGLAQAQSSALDLVAHALANGRNVSVERQSESRQLILRRILNYIEENLSNPGLSCERVAVENGVSERYLRKLFQAKGHGVSEWLWLRRLERARQDIADPLLRHRSITSIAYDWGFKDTGHFSRAFKARFGTTPSSIRAGETDS
ncbi:MAG: helix-turn-helix domain-containing protein [Parvibaculum sp.]